MTLPLIDYPDFQRPLASAEVVKVSQQASVGGGGLIGPFISDMRNYVSVALVCTAITPGVPTAYGSVDVLLAWCEDAAGAIPIFTETFCFWSQPAGGAVFLTPGGRLMFQDACRGPYLSVTLSSRSPNPIDLTARVYGASRSLGNRIVKEHDVSVTVSSTDSDVLASTGVVTTAAGAISQYPLQLHEGPVWVRYSAGITTHTFDVYTSQGLRIDQQLLAVGQIVRGLNPWPGQSMRVAVTNTGGVPGDHRLDVIAQKHSV